MFRSPLSPLLALILSCQQSAAEPLTLSEEYLTGVRIADRVSDLPDELILPDGWTEGINELISRGTQADLEHGACLLAPGDEPIDDMTMGAKYRFRAENFTIGTLGSVRYDCGTHSAAHTHPPLTNSIPSNQDIASMIGGEKSFGIAAMSETESCLYLSTNQRQEGHEEFLDIAGAPHKLKSKAIEVAAARWHIFENQSNIDIQEGIQIGFEYAPKLAFGLEKSGVGLYCSRNLSVYSKIEPEAVPPVSEEQYKSIIHALRISISDHEGRNSYPELVPDAFTSDIVEELKNSFPPIADFQEEIYTSGYRSLFAAIYLADTMENPALSIDHDNITFLSQDQQHYMITVSEDQIGVVKEGPDLGNAGWAESDRERHFLYYHRQNDEYATLQVHNEYRVIKKYIRDGRTHISFGPCLFNDKGTQNYYSCKLNGEGFLTVEGEYEYRGAFEDDRPNGEGVVVYADGSIVYATAVNGNITVHEEISPAEEPVVAIGAWRIKADVSDGYMNVRSGPGTSNPVTFTISAGSTGIQLLECRRINGSSKDWCRIDYDGQEGWLSSIGLERDR